MEDKKTKITKEKWLRKQDNDKKNDELFNEQFKEAFGHYPVSKNKKHGSGNSATKRHKRRKK